MIVLPEPVRFVWDKGNIDKNQVKHGVEPKEAEEVFFDERKVQFKDVWHTTKKEARYILLGKTKVGRVLFVVYTLRDNLIRVISARDLNKKRELTLYEKAVKHATSK